MSEESGPPTRDPAPSGAGAGATPSRSAAAGRANGSPPAEDAPELAEALSRMAERAMEQLGEIRSYVKTLASVRKDRAVHSLERTIARVVLVLIASIAAVTFVVTAVVLALRGLAGGLAALMGSAWLGQLAAGLLLLGGLAGAIAIVLRARARKEFRSKMEEYEHKRREHRARFGRHVADPPAPAARPGGAPGPGGGPGARGDR